MQAIIVLKTPNRHETRFQYTRVTGKHGINALVFCLSTTDGTIWFG